MYHLTSEEDYLNAYQQSVENVEEFWDQIARENYVWHRQWDRVLAYDFDKAMFSWFENAKLNITENALDRHLKDKGEQTAILFEPNDPAQPAEHITYHQLYKRVCKMANVLKEQGIRKGDRVVIYLPMIPELAVSLLACARIGAIHSVVFAGFSAKALTSRIQDCEAKMVLTSDGGFRGAKTISLKKIVDEALNHCSCVEKVLVVQRTGEKVAMKEDRDQWLDPLLECADDSCMVESMAAEDPLFILYTSGSTGKPKGMMHTTAGYMVYTSYTFKNVFNYCEGDIYWCTADVGWITGHSYIVYGPLLNGATTLMFEGIPSYPDCGRFWEICERHKVNQFYTAPTAIRALAKESLDFVRKYDLSSLRVIGTVGEPINEEAWNWYHEHIGQKRCPIVDTWWQTETGGILISPLPGVTPPLPTFATKPLPGIQPCLVDREGKEIMQTEAEGALCIKFPWPSMARTIWGDHPRYRETYYSSYPGMYFTGDGALRDANGNYRITGRMDDVIIVSGHNLGTAPIEDAINEHPLVAESAIVGFPHPVKGNALYGFLTLKEGEGSDSVRKEVNDLIARHISPIAKLDKIQFVPGLPKTRSGKIMRRILRKIASGETENLGDISTLLNPEIVDDILPKRIQ